MSDEQIGEFAENTNFSTKLKEWHFSIEGQPFVLREAQEADHIAYKDVSITKMRVTEDKGGEFTGGADADAVLVCKCMRKLVATGETTTEQPVPLPFIKGLPRQHFKRFLRWVRLNSGMDDEKETAEFLKKRIASDTRKLELLEKDGPVGKD